jgi:hypothetical protein
MTSWYVGIAILAGMSCGGNGTPDQNHAGAVESKMERPMHEAQRVAWRQLYWADRNFSSLRDGSRVRLILRDSGTYARSWREVTGDTSAPPTVDFRNQLVLLLAAPAQTRGGFAIAIDSVFTRPGSDTISVSVREISPGHNCTEPDDGSRPILAGTIPATTSEILFLERQAESDCAR